MEPSNPDTIGQEESVLISEVSLFQGLTNMVLGEEESVLISEVSLFQGLTNMVLGEEESVLISEVSLFQGRPYRGVHCIKQTIQMSADLLTKAV